MQEPPTTTSRPPRPATRPSSSSTTGALPPMPPLSPRPRTGAIGGSPSPSPSSAPTSPAPAEDDAQDDGELPPLPRPPSSSSFARKRYRSSPPRSSPPPSAAGGSAQQSRATPVGNGSVKWEFGGQTVYVRDATKHPPGASYAVAIIVGLACLGAVAWQMITTFSAFSAIVFDGKIWLALSHASQDAARLPVIVMCVLIAVSFQAPLLFVAFKIDKHFAQTRHQILSFSAKIVAIFDGMKEVVASNILLSIWAAIALIADTIGDVKFISFYTDSSVVLFFYATGLYGLSTIGLSECLQILWDGMVSAEWLRHVKAANDYAALKMSEMRQHSRGGASK